MICFGVFANSSSLHKKLLPKNNPPSASASLTLCIKSLNLDVIASSMGKSYDVAKNDIQKLINKGYLKNAYINEGTREIILPNNNIQVQSEVVSNATTNNVATKIVACQCCAANNTIVGDVGECEYCGSPLK